MANLQNVYNLAAERGPSSFDVKLMNVTSVVWQVPFGRGRKFGSNTNSVVDAMLGGWELNTIHTGQHRASRERRLHPSAANDATGRIPDYRGLAVQRPNLVGDPTGASGPARIDQYFNKAAFAIPPANAPFGNLWRNAFRHPISGSGTSGSTRTSAFRCARACGSSSGRSSSTS